MTASMLAATLVSAELGLVTGEYDGKAFSLTETSEGVWQNSNGRIDDDAFVYNLLTNWRTIDTRFTNVSGDMSNLFEEPKEENLGLVTGEWDGKAFSLVEIREGIWQNSNGKINNDNFVSNLLANWRTMDPLFSNVTGNMSQLFDQPNEGLGLVTGEWDGGSFSLTEISEGVWQNSNGKINDDDFVQNLLLNWSTMDPLFSNVTGFMSLTPFVGGKISGKFEGISFHFTEISRGVWLGKDNVKYNDAQINLRLQVEFKDESYTEISGGFAAFNNGVNQNITGKFEGKDFFITAIAEDLWINSNGKVLSDAQLAMLMHKIAQDVGFSEVTGGFPSFTGGVVTTQKGWWIDSHYENTKFTEYKEGYWVGNNGGHYLDSDILRILDVHSATVTGSMRALTIEEAIALVTYEQAIVTSPWLSQEGTYITGSATDVVEDANTIYYSSDFNEIVYTGSQSEVNIGDNVLDGDILYTRTGKAVKLVNDQLIAQEDILDFEGNVLFAKDEVVLLQYDYFFKTKLEENTVISLTSSIELDTGIVEAWNNDITGEGVTISTMSLGSAKYIAGRSVYSIEDGDVIFSYGIAKDAELLTPGDVSLIDLSSDIILADTENHDLSSLVTDALIVQAAGASVSQSSEGADSASIVNLLNSNLRDQVIIVATLDLIDNPNTPTFDEVTGQAINLTITRIQDDELVGIDATYDYDQRLLGKSCGSIAMDRCVVEFSINGDHKSASAVVAGKAALLMQKFSDKSASEIADRIFETAVDLGETGVDAVYGHGLVNLYAALRNE